MRNLKKILALALVFAMAFTFTAGAASFTDAADIGTNYLDDVNMLVELGVLAGYPDGSFGPAKNITRAEFAKMAYTLKYGSDADGNLFAAQASKFVDVEGNANVAWAKGYINYCANQNIVSGVGANKFNPQGNITVAEAAKMILVILGCDPAKEGFTGANWMSNVVSKAIDLGVFNGWAGDPSALATRELVAKLMRNAVFAPIYTYSAITGAGSQVNALGTAYNKTLGETTMGLYHETGIVVANEHNYIESDEKGGALLDQPVGFGATADDEMSIIYYTTTLNGVVSGKYLEINRGLSDELLGNKVDVYFTADIQKDATTGYIQAYHDAEVIGNVLVSSDTVVYNVQASAVELLPAHKSESEALVRPYISFADEDGNEVKISTPSTVAKIAKKAVAEDDTNVTSFFNKFAYVSSTNATSEGTYSKVGTYNSTTNVWDDTSKTFVDDMGSNNLAQYRFVSVDGGKTYSYIFKTNAVATSIAYVTAYNEAKGTIALSGIGNKDFEEVTIKGDVAVDDMVACFYADDKLVVEKVETISGAVEGFNDDGSVSINGKDYFAWASCKDGNKNAISNLFDYYVARPATMEGATYYVCGNLIIRLDSDAKAVAATNYAILLNAYDDTHGTAFVTLGFADGTSKKYEVGKMFESRNSGGKDDDATHFTGLAIGGLVKYKVLDNGTVDLSAQTFRTDAISADAEYKYRKNTATGINEGAVVVSGAKVFPESDETVVFVIYDDASTVSAPKFATYKVADIKALTPAATTVLGASAADVVFDDDTSTTKNVVVAAMTIATDSGNNYAFQGLTSNDETATFALVVNAMQRYNSATDKYYAELTLVNQDGLFTATTVEDVQNYSNQSALDPTKKIGNISVAGSTFPAGTFVLFEKNAEGLIDRLDYKTLDGSINGTTINVASYAEAQGFYLVNVISDGSGRITFYDSVTGADDTDLTNNTVLSAKYDKDGYKVITVGDEEYLGESLVTLAANESELKKDKGNAIIYLNKDKEVEYVYSFVDGYTK